MMAGKRFPRPFFVTARGVWRVQIHGTQYNLGPDEDAARVEYDRLMAEHYVPGRRKTPGTPSSPRRLTGSLYRLLDDFLGWVEAHQSPRSYEIHRDYLRDFSKHAPPDLDAEKVRPHHLESWADAHASWGDTTRRLAIRSVQRAVNWARKGRRPYLPESCDPLRGLEKPPQVAREKYLTPDEYAVVMSRITHQPFRDLLTVVWETGCRPQEARTASAEHLDRAGARWVFPRKKSKGKKRQRIVYLNPRAFEVVLRNVGKYPQGPTLRNGDGKPWTDASVGNHFYRYNKKYGNLHCLYDFRHGFCTRALKAGVDPVTVSVLMGHADTSMVTRVYAHVHQDVEHIRQAADRV
jgi:integrase/recombinase XerC